MYVYYTYIYMYICYVYTCIYICYMLNINTYTCYVYECVYVIYWNTFICTYALSLYEHIHTYVFMSVNPTKYKRTKLLNWLLLAHKFKCIYTCIYTYPYIQIYLLIYICMRILINLHTYTYICMCIHLYTYIHIHTCESYDISMTKASALIPTRSRRGASASTHSASRSKAFSHSFPPQKIKCENVCLFSLGRGGSSTHSASKSSVFYAHSFFCLFSIVISQRIFLWGRGPPPPILLPNLLPLSFFSQLYDQTLERFWRGGLDLFDL